MPLPLLAAIPALAGAGAGAAVAAPTVAATAAPAVAATAAPAVATAAPVAATGAGATAAAPAAAGGMNPSKAIQAAMKVNQGREEDKTRISDAARSSAAVGKDALPGPGLASGVSWEQLIKSYGLA